MRACKSTWVAIVSCLIAISMSAGLLHASDHTLRGKHLELGLACKDCHGTDTPERRAPVSACINCHGQVKLETRDLKDGELVRHVNPHQSHLGEVPCTLCHKMHQPSVLYCNDCHKYDQRVP